MQPGGSPADGYRIIDEAAGGGPSGAIKAPWNPVALFFLMWIAGVFAGPLGAVAAAFSAVNWARLGQPQKRWPWLALAVLLGLLPFLLAVPVRLWGVPSLEVARLLNKMALFGLAYGFLLGQRPLFDSHLARGGKATTSWPLWLGGALVVALLWLAQTRLAETPPKSGIVATSSSR